MRKLKYTLTAEDGSKLWSAKRDGWQVSGYGRLSLRTLGVEYHSMPVAGETGAKLGVATCRVCGGKIEAAASRFMVMGDPGDGGGWTMQKWYVHAEPCVALSPISEVK